MNRLLLILTWISSGLMAQTTYMVDFSDTAQVNQYFYSDSIIDPRGNWKVLSDSGTALGGVYFETDTAFVDSINSSCIIKLPLNLFVYSTIDFQTTINFLDSTLTGVVDYSINSGLIWRRVPITPDPRFYGGMFPNWSSYLPVQTDQSDSTSIAYFGSQSGTSVMHFACYALKTDAQDVLWLRFTVRKTDAIRGTNSWNFGSINVLSPGGVCTGINDEKNNIFKLYPVPATNSISFDASKNSTQIFKVSIFDIQGRIIWQGNQKSNETIPVRHLDSGIYLLSLEDLDTGISAFKRFVKE
jgi:hypothetical protein